MSSWTAAASLSSRRVRALVDVGASSAIWARSHSSRATRPSCPSRPASCSSSATCSTSVRVRSPPGRASTRAVSPSATSRSRTAAIPCRAWTAARSRQVWASRSSSSSPPSSTATGSCPSRSVRAAARVSTDRCGATIASSRVSHSWAARVCRTDMPPALTAWIPRSRNASWARTRSLPLCASTATSLARTGRPSKVASDPSRAATSRARSGKTCSRNGPMRSLPPRCSSSSTCRSRTGASLGAPSRRLTSMAASIGWTTICGSPSWAPSSSVPRARTTPASER
ncbi:hypothetical protein [Ornithinimicrobium kibberense]|uniref:hypothetical protein n=1 Tax=Ornithinimicrobium kibberense TaxID=282060 RepID=UPI00361E6D39